MKSMSLSYFSDSFEELGIEVAAKASVSGGAAAANEPSASSLEDLLIHIRHRTFDRLHDLNVIPLAEGRLLVSAIAHSRFVGQLAEWAVLERVAPADVDLSISVCLPPRRFSETQK